MLRGECKNLCFYTSNLCFFADMSKFTSFMKFESPPSFSEKVTVVQIFIK